MGSLSGTLSISVRALQAQQTALQTTSENISNINTPGYTRQRTVMTEESPTMHGDLLVGNGVKADRIESLRDRVLELRIDQEMQFQGELSGFLVPMKQVDTAIGGVEDGLGADMSSFFNAMTRLSTDPSNIPLRQNVLTAAGNLASTFVNSARSLRSVQADIDAGLRQKIGEVNELSSKIAALNDELSHTSDAGQCSGKLEDQRTKAMQELSRLIGVSVVDSDAGLVIATADGAPLVVGGESFSLQTGSGPGGAQHVFAGKDDLTADIHGGEIGGALRARDIAIGGLLERLNTLASCFTASVNAAHRGGIDLNGDPGGSVFSEVIGPDAAANMKLELRDAAKLAVSSDGSAGDNGNLSRMVAIRNSDVVAGTSPLSYYAATVAEAGSHVANAESEQQASELILQQLNIQRSSVSGVSLDEEAANLIRFQRAFEAAARVISVVDELTEMVIGLGRN